MNILKTGSQNVQMMKGVNRFHTQEKTDNSAEMRQKKAAVTETKPTVQDSRQIPGQEKVKGVVRLLHEGHFKGVADIRLRINFHEQLHRE